MTEAEDAFNKAVGERNKIIAQKAAQDAKAKQDAEEVKSIKSNNVMIWIGFQSNLREAMGEVEKRLSAIGFSKADTRAMRFGKNNDIQDQHLDMTDGANTISLVVSCDTASGLISFDDGSTYHHRLDLVPTPAKQFFVDGLLGRAAKVIDVINSQGVVPD